MRRGLLLPSWLLIVLILSVMPVPETDVGPKGLDKFVHFALYGITALLFWRFFYNKTWSRRKIGLISIVSASLYGLLMEIIQSFLPYRTFSVSDIISNFLGAIFSVTIILTRKMYLK